MALKTQAAILAVVALTGVGSVAIGLDSAPVGAVPAPPGAVAPGALRAPASSGPSAAALARPPAPRTHGKDGSSVIVYGHGLGPGWGMGQWGAYGYASLNSYRWPYQRIVEHYYGGTHLSRVTTSVEAMPVDVDLSGLDNASTTAIEANRRGAFLSVNGVKRWGIRTIAHTGRKVTVKASAGDVRVDLSGTWTAYQGWIEIQPDGQTWNIVPLEDYVAGVVPIESSAGWGATGGEAALQAQAVAARSYVLSYIAAAGHICDSQQCQVYRGDPGTNPNIGSYVRYSNEATRSSAGMVMCRVAGPSCVIGDVVSTQYGSSTGGFTAGGGSPALPAVLDAGDAVSANPWHDWTIDLSVAEVEDAYPAVGALSAVKVSKRNGHGQMGGRAVTVTITGRNDSTAVAGATFAAEFGLYSDWFRFSTQP